MSQPNSRETAECLHNLGYFPFPLVPGTKRPAVRGFFGHSRPDNATITTAIAAIGERTPLAISLPLGVIGLDVDSYASGDGHKTGGTALCALESQLGPLPDTWLSTRRGPQPKTGPARTGIYLFQLPAWMVTADTEGLVKLVSAAAPGIELIQYHERFLVCAPTVLDAMTYRWYHPTAGDSPLPPPVEELPVLPAAWAQHLYGSGLAHADGTAVTKGLTAVRELFQEWRDPTHWGTHRRRLRDPRAARTDAGGAARRASRTQRTEYDGLDFDEAMTWASVTLPGWTEEPNDFLAAKLAEFDQEFGTGSRHDLVRDTLWHILRLCAGDERTGTAGNPGGDIACRHVCAVLIDARDRDAGGTTRVGRDEVARMMAQAVAKLRGDIDTGILEVAQRVYGAGLEENEDDYLDVEDFLAQDRGGLDPCDGYMDEDDLDYTLRVLDSVDNLDTVCADLDLMMGTGDSLHTALETVSMLADTPEGMLEEYLAATRKTRSGSGHR